MSRRGGLLPQTSGDQIIEVDEEGKVSVAGEGASSTKRPRRKSGSAVSIGKDGAVFIRLPEDLQREFHDARSAAYDRRVDPEIVGDVVVDHLGALKGKVLTLVHAKVVQGFQAPEAKGGGGDDRV